MNSSHFLERPNNNDYLWKFFRSFERLEDFMNGKIFLSSLASFDDYYESITPLHFNILQFINNLKILDYNKGLEKKFFPDFRNIVQIIEVNKIENNLFKIWELKNKVDLSKKIMDSIKALPEIFKKHDYYQIRVYASCWIINNSYEEDYLMWKSYSAPGGFAIKINYKHFSNILKSALSYPENKHFYDQKITKSLHLGKVIYHNFLFEDKWIDDVKRNIPLSFLKHSSYKHENEFRICAEFYNSTSELNKINFLNLSLFGDVEIILHPSCYFYDYEKYITLFKKYNINPRIKFSSLSCRKI
jgi:hypothetical protein